MKQSEIDEIKARRDAAPPGPWALGMLEIRDADGDPVVERVSTSAEFIAHAPTDIAQLVAEVEKLRGLLAGALRHDAWDEEAWALIDDIAERHMIPGKEHLFEGEE